MTEDTRTIAERMAAVMADVGAIGKNDTAGTGSFSYPFRGIDQVMNALHPVLVKHGVFLLPDVRHVETDWTTTGQKGTKTRVVAITVAYRFVGLMGDEVESVTHAEAFDTSDKASNKALATAMRYALLQVFCIPTNEEQEREHYELSTAPPVSDDLWERMKTLGGRVSGAAGDDFPGVKARVLAVAGVDAVHRDIGDEAARMIMDEFTRWLEENTEPFDLPEATRAPQPPVPPDGASEGAEAATDADGLAVGLLAVSDATWKHVKGLKKSDLVYELGHRGKPVAGTADELRERLAQVITEEETAAG